MASKKEKRSKKWPYTTVNRKVKLVKKQNGFLAEDVMVKSKKYDTEDDHTIGENNVNRPVVVVKLTGRGYAVVDTAKDFAYVTSEVKFNKKCVCYIHNSNCRLVGKFFFDTDMETTFPEVRDENGTVICMERQGILRIKYRDKKGRKKRDKRVIPPGFVFTITAGS